MYFYLLAIAVFLLDQLSKLAVIRMMEPNQSIPIINNVFHLTYVRNIGAAFGILANRTWFFIAVGSIVAVLIIVYSRYVPDSQIFLKAALALQLGGLTGNLADRIFRQGRVVDFFDFQIWPVFNIADMAIVIGIGLLILDLLFVPGRKEA